MRKINTYITEKLHLNKNIKETNIINYNEVKEVIDEYLKEVMGKPEKYEVSIEDKNEIVYINIDFGKDLDNDVIHTRGLDLFNIFYNKDKDKYYKLNHGSDWWVSSARNIILKFRLK